MAVGVCRATVDDGVRSAKALSSERDTGTPVYICTLYVVRKGHTGIQLHADCNFSKERNNNNMYCNCL